MKHIERLLHEAITRADFPHQPLDLKAPTLSTFGDYTTTVALSIAKKIKRNPKEVAEEIVKAIPQDPYIQQISVVLPGYINITLSKEGVAHALKDLIKLQVSTYKGKRVTVEYTDPNPFKEFHVGHLYTNTVGEAIARLVEACGGEVRRICYQGDVGLHVASSIWGMIQYTSQELKLKSPHHITLEDAQKVIQEFETQELSKRVEWLGQCYAHGAKVLADKSEPQQQEIRELNAQIFEIAQQMWKEKDPLFTQKVDYTSLIGQAHFPKEVVALFYRMGREWTLAHFETIYKRLGTHYGDEKNYYFESFVAEAGYEAVMQGLKEGIFTKSENAVVFKGEDYGLHTRVFINAYGLPTYEAKELGLNPKKFADWPCNVSLILTGNEVEQYFKVVLQALSLIHPDVAAKTKHIPHGMVRLPEGKMSSRTGKIIKATTLLQEVKDALIELSEKSKRNPIPSDTLEKISVAAVKYSLLKTAVGKDIVFDITQSLSLVGNSGPYLQYTLVRIKKVLQKAGNLMAHITPTLGEFSEENEVLKTLIHYPQALEEAALAFSPHILCTYLHKLAKLANNYYDTLPVLTSSEEVRNNRLAIYAILEKVISDGICALGFEVVDEM